MAPRGDASTGRKHCCLGAVVPTKGHISRVYSLVAGGRALESYKAPAAVSSDFSSPFLAWRSLLPPMCFLPMKTLGTVRWPEIS